MGRKNITSGLRNDSKDSLEKLSLPFAIMSSNYYKSRKNYNPSKEQSAVYTKNKDILSSINF